MNTIQFKAAVCASIAWTTQWMIFDYFLQHI